MNPETPNLIATAVHSLWEPTHACRHVFTGRAATLTYCAEHPAMGVLCSTCWLDHIAHRGHEGTDRCSTCGDPLAVDFEIAFPMLTLTNPQSGGESIQVNVRVNLAGIVVDCPRCT